ncbi:acyl-CoA reductase [Fodinibius sp.]|uniref:acyl-CoA reductase n=1 Tax=Fodinibius sp. TaxID=1872440 RepID=UPI0035638F52
MADIEKRITTLLEATQSWLQADNHYLMDAIDRTVQEGYFSFEDVQFAIDAIQKSIDREAIQAWAGEAGLNGGYDHGRTQHQNVLCLHAGNLPLVGFQDAFSTLLSGSRYTGKISRKDPYLLPTFLNEVKKTAIWTGVNVQWAHRLDDFEGMQNDAIIFAGSESSVPGVREAIRKWNLAGQDCRYLIRTAHFSMAFLDRKEKRVIEDLVEGIFRYGGKGCRSVALVVSGYSLDEIKSELQEAVHSFWLENPQHLIPPPGLRQQYAYNEAVERPQLWLDHFLLQEGGLEFDRDFVSYWVQGDEETVAELAEQYERQLQSVYIAHPGVEIQGLENQTELLGKAQQPSISWKPDGVDTLAWLVNS